MQILFYLDQLEIKNLEASKDKTPKDEVSLLYKVNLFLNIMASDSKS